MKTNRRFGIREKHVMNSLQDHPASPGVSKWGCANCSLYWKAKELCESQQNKTPSWSLRLYCLYHQSEKWGRIRAIRMVSTLLLGKDYERPMKPFSLKSRIFGLGQTNWANRFWGIFGQTISIPILVQWVPCLCFSLFNHYFYKKIRQKTKHLFGIWIWARKN